MFKGAIAQGTLRASLVLGVRLFIQAGTLLLVARMLGPNDFGAFVGTASLALILGMVSTFGTNVVILKEVSQDPSRRDVVLSRAIPVTFLCGGLLFLIFLLSAYYFLGHSALPWPAVLAIGLAEVFLQPFLEIMSSEQHAFGRVARAQLLQVIPLVLRLASAIGVFFLELTPVLTIYCVGYIVASLIALLIGWHQSPKVWPNWRRWRLPSAYQWYEALGYAVISVSKAGPTELDKTLAARLLSTESSGIYAASSRIVGAITLPVSAMIMSALPRLFRARTFRASGAVRLLVWMSSAAFLYSVTLSFGLWLSAPMLEGWFGEKYQGMQETIRWLSWVVPGMSMRFVAGNALMALGKPWLRATTELFGLLVLVMVSIFMSFYYGILGMALAVLIAEYFMASIGFLFVFKNFHSEQSHY